MDAAMRRLVQAQAGARCEYCRIHEDDEPYTFHVEHIVAKKHGGSNDPSNLAWSCHSCNFAKSSNLSGWLQGHLPLTDAEVRHPDRIADAPSCQARGIESSLELGQRWFATGRGGLMASHDDAKALVAGHGE